MSLTLSHSTRSLLRVVCCLAILGGALGTERSAEAFCGFYVGGADTKLFNNATQVVLMREGTKTVLSMQNNYEGPAEDFAMVVPVPQILKKEHVKVLPQKVFDRVDRLAAPRLVEYFERDPCFKPVEYRETEGAVPSPTMAVRGGAPPKPQLGVKIEAQFEVGEYDVVVLSAKESNGLETWLKQNKYNIPAGAAPALKPYVQKGLYFFVAKVNQKKVEKDEGGRPLLSPLRFHYDSKDFFLPVRLGLLNAKGKQDLIVHILAKSQRYEVANFKNVTIPTNIIVKKEIRKRFGEFYATLLDRTLEENPGAVVTEYSWNASTCDPCPVPGLRHQDFITLGADVAKSAPSAKAPPMPGGRFGWARGGWVLTRLHARYSADQLKDDLVFKKADPIVGGRGTPQGLEGKISERVSKSGSVNNFQGRYIMLHPWEKPIKCENPRRGVWGWGNRGKTMTADRDVAFAPRGKLTLPAAVAVSEIPGLKIKLPAVKKPAATPVKAAKAAKGDASAGQKSGAKAAKPAAKKAGCAVSGTDATPGSLSALLLAVGLLGWRRRRA